MKAVLITEPHIIEVGQVEMPVLKEGEALLKIRYCGICGADIADRKSVV